MCGEELKGVKRELRKISHLMECDIFAYKLKEDAKYTDYVIMYSNSSVIVKKKVLWFWIEVVMISESQVAEVLLNEIYGG